MTTRFVPGDLVLVRPLMGFVSRPTPDYFTNRDDASVYGRLIHEGETCLVCAVVEESGEAYDERTRVLSSSKRSPLSFMRDGDGRFHVLLLSGSGVLGWGDDDWVDKVA